MGARSGISLDPTSTVMLSRSQAVRHCASFWLRLMIAFLAQCLKIINWVVADRRHLWCLLFFEPRWDPVSAS